jgi:hypothetical protein
LIVNSYRLRGDGKGFKRSTSRCERMRRRPQNRVIESSTRSEDQILRYPFLLGGNPAARNLTAEQRLSNLRRDSKNKHQIVSLQPQVPRGRKRFAVLLTLPKGKRNVGLIRLEVRFPSGTIRKIDYVPSASERKKGSIKVDGFQSDNAGDIYISARLYLFDGSTISAALLRNILSMNPDQLVITPRTWLVSGRAGRVEYDWDTNEFHCRAYGTITNGSDMARTFRRCHVRVTDGGVGGTEITSFSFNVGPFTVQPSAAAYRTIDTWYPQGTSVWDKFNQRWDLTIQFTYEADNGIMISDDAVYRPMSTVPLNAIKTTDFTSSQTTAERNAVAIASEILEDRDVTIYNPNWRILANQVDKDRFGIIDIGWTNNDHDFDEAHDLYEEISGPDQDRSDVYIPVSFQYTPEVPADERNVGGFSTINGPYPKDDEPRRSGSTVLLDENDQEFFGVAIAHEVCHYLGLEHEQAQDNLMEKTGGVTGHKLTWTQWDKIRQHGMMKWLAPDI